MRANALFESLFRFAPGTSVGQTMFSLTAPSDLPSTMQVCPTVALFVMLKPRAVALPAGGRRLEEQRGVSYRRVPQSQLRRLNKALARQERYRNHTQWAV